MSSASNLPAGRELDEAAARAMGWRLVDAWCVREKFQHWKGPNGEHAGSDPPRLSTDPARIAEIDAWLLAQCPEDEPRIEITILDDCAVAVLPALDIIEGGDDQMHARARLVVAVAEEVAS